jgi:hypothetical protein
MLPLPDLGLTAALCKELASPLLVMLLDLFIGVLLPLVRDGEAPPSGLGSLVSSLE